MKIPLGTIVKDRVTGLVGVAENRATYLYGCDRYCVQPRIDGSGKVPDSIMVDEPQLEIVKDQDPVMPCPDEPPQTIKLGYVVHDPIRGMTGTVIGRAVYLNGCSRVCVEPRQDGKYKLELWWEDEPRMVLKTTLTGAPKTTARADTIRRTGGPAPSSKY